MKILLVAGHGAGDPGAVGNGFREADLARELVVLLRSKLLGVCNVDIFNTGKNMYKYLKAGGNFDFSFYDYVLEVHFNSGAGDESGNERVTGSEMLIHTKEKGDSVERAMLKHLELLGLKNRGVKRRSDLRNMNILKGVGIPYALAEICFIDDKDDMELYQRKKEEVANALAEGLKEGFGLEKNEITTVNDIVWELYARGIVKNRDLWIRKLQEDTNAYWLARKCVGYIMNR